MNVWILLMVFYTTGTPKYPVGATAIEFNSRAACETALKSLEGGLAGDIRMACLEKGK